MNTHLETKLVKFNRKNHKSDPWITYGILKSVNRKIKKTGSDSLLYDDRKHEFNCYKNCHRRIVNRSKKYN